MKPTKRSPLVPYLVAELTLAGYGSDTSGRNGPHMDDGPHITQPKPVKLGKIPDAAEIVYPRRVHLCDGSRRAERNSNYV